jgi:hypothetical protein
MTRRKQAVLNFLVVLAVMLSVVGIAPTVANPATSPVGDGPRQTKPPIDVTALEEGTLTPEQALDKIDPTLREAANSAGKASLEVYVSVVAGTDLSAYLAQMITRPVVFGNTQSVYGKVRAADLIALAQQPGVVAIFSVGSLREKPVDEDKATPSQAQLQTRLATLRAQAVPYEEAQANQATAKGWFDVQDGHKSAKAWEKGFTGDGVVVGVLDDGIDFGHPDLQGTYAWVTDPASPYYGWPMAFSQVSTRYFAYDVILDAGLIADGAAGSRWTDAQTTVAGHINPWAAQPRTITLRRARARATCSAWGVCPSRTSSGCTAKARPSWLSTNTLPECTIPYTSIWTGTMTSQTRSQSRKKVLKSIVTWTAMVMRTFPAVCWSGLAMAPILRPRLTGCGVSRAPMPAR